MRELLCFAAALGFEKEQRLPLGTTTAEVDARVWENLDSAVDMVYLVGVAGAQNLDVLQPDREEELVTIFEEFANGGLQILDGWLRAQGGDVYGDQAILTSLRREGLLGESPKSVSKAIDDVSF